MSQPQTPETLTIAEKEKIIEIKVKELESDKNRRLCFYVKGDGYTRLMRDAWSSDMPIHAMQKLGVEGLGMSLDLAIKVVTGKMMFIGDSRIESYPGGIELVEDDGRFGDDFENYSLEEMVKRLEKYYIEASNRRMIYVRVLNLLKEDLKDDEDPIQITDDPNSEWLSPREIREHIEALNEKIKKYTDELDFLYPTVKKTLRDLPLDQIGTEPISELENELAKSAGTGNVQKKDREQVIAVYNKNRKKAEKQSRKDQEKLERDREKIDLEAHRPIITPIKDENLNTVHSCWLLPDGTMFGGPQRCNICSSFGPNFIHDHIMYYLKQDKFFKNPDVIDEKTLETMGWCKFSQGHGFMLYDRINDEDDEKICYTEAQRLKIIDWAIANT